MLNHFSLDTAKFLKYNRQTKYQTNMSPPKNTKHKLKIFQLFGSEYECMLLNDTCILQGKSPNNP